MQGGTSLFGFHANRSFWRGKGQFALFKERIAFFTLFEKSGKSNSLSSLFLKEQRERMLSFTKSKKSNKVRFALLFWT